MDPTDPISPGERRIFSTAFPHNRPAMLSVRRYIRNNLSLPFLPSKKKYLDEVVPTLQHRSPSAHLTQSRRRDYSSRFESSWYASVMAAARFRATESFRDLKGQLALPGGRT